MLQRRTQMTCFPLKHRRAYNNNNNDKKHVWKAPASHSNTPVGRNCRFGLKKKLFLSLPFFLPSSLPLFLISCSLVLCTLLCSYSLSFPFITFHHLSFPFLHFFLSYLSFLSSIHLIFMIILFQSFYACLFVSWEPCSAGDIKIINWKWPVSKDGKNIYCAEYYKKKS